MNKNLTLSILAVALLASLLFAAPTEEGEPSDPCSGYEPSDLIPTKPSNQPMKLSDLCKKIAIPLAIGVGVGAASFFAPMLALGALGFTGSGVASGSIAAATQSAFYGGLVPAGSWFAAFQAAGATGVAIAQGSAIAIGATSTGVTYYWYGSGKVPSSKKEWKEMEEKCEKCVTTRFNCEPAKLRLFEQLELEKSRLGWTSRIQKGKMMENENWESFVRLSCRCFPVFKNMPSGEGSHEKDLGSLFRYYVPYFYPTSNEDGASTSATCE